MLRADDGVMVKPRSVRAGVIASGALVLFYAAVVGGASGSLEPHHLDASGAEFVVTLDTHSEELDMDLVAGARLVVDGTRWPATAWDGDGTGGHHCEGRLRFDAAGPAAGPVDMSLDGFAAPGDAEVGFCSPPGLVRWRSDRRRGRVPR